MSIDHGAIIVGGLSGGVPSRTILRFDPGMHRVRVIGQLPVALAHVAIGTLGGLVFVIGGRGAGPGSETRAIYGIDPKTGRVRFAGRLPAGLADAASATVSDRILVAGGVDRSGRAQSTVFEVSLPSGA